MIDQKLQISDVIQEVPHNTPPSQERGTFDSDRSPELLVLVQEAALRPAELVQNKLDTSSAEVPGKRPLQVLVAKTCRFGTFRQASLPQKSYGGFPEKNWDAKVCSKVKMDIFLAKPSISAHVLIGRKAYFSNLVL